MSLDYEQVELLKGVSLVCRCSSALLSISVSSRGATLSLQHICSQDAFCSSQAAAGVCNAGLCALRCALRAYHSPLLFQVCCFKSQAAVCACEFFKRCGFMLQAYLGSACVTPFNTCTASAQRVLHAEAAAGCLVR